MVCSIVSSNYLAQARVLQESLASTNPDLPFTLLVLDFDATAGDNQAYGFQVVGLDFLDRNTELSRMRLVYDVVEFATAVKPFFLKKLVSEGYDVALYFDPDILVCRSLSDLVRKTVEHQILLTPHSLGAYPRDGLSPSELDIMRAGIFNLGFIGVAHSATNFLDWWAERLETQCLIQPEAGLFTDQRWVDWVPSLFSAGVYRSPGANVAYWNLHERTLLLVDSLSLSGEFNPGPLAEELGMKVSVNNEPLLFFHFSGFNPTLPKNITKHFFGNLRVSLSQMPLVSHIFELYGKALISRGFLESSKRPTDSDWVVEGVDYGPEIRKFLRDEWVPTVGGDFDFPDPLSNRSDFISYYFQKTAKLSQESRGNLKGLIRKVLESLRRNGVRQTLVKILAGLRWRRQRAFANYRRREFGAEPGNPTRNDPNLLLVNYLEQDFSIGVVGQRIQKILQDLDIKHQVLSRRETTGSYLKSSPLGAEEISTRSMLVIANADATPSILGELGASQQVSGKVIGYWFWEVEHVPVDMFSEAQGKVDEVWVASRFVADILRPALHKPVVEAPLQLFDPERHGNWTTMVDLRERTEFTFLAVGDLNSVPNRKNLTGVVEAFCKAFPRTGAARLVIKARVPRPSQQALLGYEELRQATESRSDIEFVDRRLSSEEMDQLFLSSHAFISLHRAEGLGLNISDAVSFGLPVIATEYGGCMDFLRKDSAFLVPFEHRSIGLGSQPYSPFATWAEPNLDVAVSLMRAVQSDYDDALEKAQLGRKRIIKEFGPEAVGAIWKDLLLNTK